MHFSAPARLDFKKKKTHQTDTVDILSSMVYVRYLLFLTLAVAWYETRTGIMIVLATEPSRTDRNFSHVNKLVFCLVFLAVLFSSNRH